VPGDPARSAGGPVTRLCGDRPGTGCTAPGGGREGRRALPVVVELAEGRGGRREQHDPAGRAHENARSTASSSPRVSITATWAGARSAHLGGDAHAARRMATTKVRLSAPPEPRRAARSRFPGRAMAADEQRDSLVRKGVSAASVGARSSRGCRRRSARRRPRRSFAGGSQRHEPAVALASSSSFARTPKCSRICGRARIAPIVLPGQPEPRAPGHPPGRARPSAPRGRGARHGGGAPRCHRWPPSAPLPAACTARACRHVVLGVPVPVEMVG